MALPRVTILGTGGTIAGTADSAAKTAQYKTADLTVDDLVEAVPELKDIASLEVEKVCQVGSPDITGKQLVAMAGRIDKLLASPDVDGVVVTHGTDTLEETAYFLDLTIQSPKPVVVVGAMRPATAMSADGPRNLYGAVKLASCKEAHNRGVLVFHNDKIIAANFVTKVHANNVDAFTGGDAGCLGSFDDDEINFYSGATRPSVWIFPIDKVISKIRSKKLPRVQILYGYLEPDVELFNAAVDLYSKGIVLAGMGAGCWETVAGKDISKYAEENNFPVVASRRTAHGYVGSNEIYGLGSSIIGARYLNPAKCRIKLQVALACEIPVETIAVLFQTSGNNRTYDLAE